MTIDAKLLEIMCCPVTRVPVEVMSGAVLEKLNERIAASKLVNRGGTVLTETLEDALVTRDGKLAYPIRDGIPVLLEDHGIVLTQLEGS